MPGLRGGDDPRGIAPPPGDQKPPRWRCQRKLRCSRSELWVGLKGGSDNARKRSNRTKRNRADDRLGVGRLRRSGRREIQSGRFWWMGSRTRPRWRWRRWRLAPPLLGHRSAGMDGLWRIRIPNTRASGAGARDRDAGIRAEASPGPTPGAAEHRVGLVPGILESSWDTHQGGCSESCCHVYW